MKGSFKILLCTAALCVTAVALRAQDAVVDRIIEIGTTDNRTMHFIDVLSNRIGGRLVGSDAYENATYWTAEQFRKMGLEVEIQEVGTLPVGFNRGPWFGRMLDDRDGMTLTFTTPSYTAGTKGVQRGHVVAEPKTKADFERVKGKLNGAWVLVTGMNNGWPIDYSARGDSIRGSIIAHNEPIARYNDSIARVNRANPSAAPIAPRQLRDAPALFYKEMREAGILGIIQASEIPIRTLYDRENHMKLDFDTNLPTCPDIKLDRNQYEIIARKVAERRWFQLEFEIRNFFKPGPVKYHNVIGILRGSEFPDEYVMMGGHLDAFDVATGAVDCGTGAAPALEAARLITRAGGKPRRTILFCLWAAEEFGLVGSRYWVEQNRDKHDKISNYFNRDSGPLVANSLTVSPAMYDDFLYATQKLGGIDPRFDFTLVERKGPAPEKPTRPGSSDHAWFEINGIPAVSFEIGDPLGHDFIYNDIWHTERDTYNMSIPEYMNHTSVVTAVTVYNLANRDKMLSREGLYRAPEPAPAAGRRGRR